MPKCYICKKNLEKKDAYMYIHISNSGKEYKRYACSQEEVENDKRDKALYKQIQLITDEILGYPCVNNNRNKRIQDLQNAGYTNEQIYRCFKEYKSEIEKWIEFNKIDKEFNKLAYMFSVVGANIKDFTVDDERKNEWVQSVPQEENIDIVFEETEDEVLKRLKNKKEKENSLADFLNGLK